MITHVVGCCFLACNTGLFVKGNDKSSMVVRLGHIAKADVERFRVGRFEEQSDKIKEKWFFVMLKLLPCVNAEFRRSGVKSNKLVSKATAAENEAILCWILEFHMDDWKAEIEADAKAAAEGTVAPKRKKSGKTKSIQHVKEFFARLKDVTKARENDTRGKGWDLALQAEIRRRICEEQPAGASVPCEVVAGTDNGNEEEADGLMCCSLKDVAAVQCVDE